MQFFTQPRKHLTELAVFPYEGAPVHYKTPTVELRVDSMLDTYNLFQRLRVLDMAGNEIAWNKRSIKYNKKGDDYGYIRVPLVKSLEAGQDYRLILDMDISDTAGIHLPAARDIVFRAVDAGADKPGMEVVEEFENADDFMAYTGNRYIHMGHSLSPTNSTDRLFGGKSMQLAYDFDNGVSPVEIRYSHENEGCTFHLGDTVGVHVWGDMSCNTLYLGLAPVNDSVPYISYIPLTTVDFHGWRYLTLPIVSNDDGDLPDIEYSFYGFMIRRGHDVMGKDGGTIRFDNLVKKAASGVDEVPLAGMKMKVAGDYIVVSADTWVQGIELLDIQGRTVKAAGGNCLNVADVPAGIYLVRIHINGRSTTRKVALGQ